MRISNACYSICCNCTVTRVECYFLITEIDSNGPLSSAMRFLTYMMSNTVVDIFLNKKWANCCNLSFVDLEIILFQC